MILFFKFLSYLLLVWFVYLVYITYGSPFLKSLFRSVTDFNAKYLKTSKNKPLIVPPPKRGNIWIETEQLPNRPIIAGENPIQLINNFLKAKQLFFKVNESGNCFNIPFDLDNRETGEVYVYVDNKNDRINFKAVFRHNFPDEMVYRVAELSTRINEKLLFGKFNMLYDERMLVFDVDHFLFERELTGFILDFYFRICLFSMEEFKPLVSRVIDKGEEPILVVIEHFSDIDNSRRHSQSWSK